jgi:hypothetical protein
LGTVESLGDGQLTHLRLPHRRGRLLVPTEPIRDRDYPEGDQPEQRPERHEADGAPLQQVVTRRPTRPRLLRRRLDRPRLLRGRCRRLLLAAFLGDLAGDGGAALTATRLAFDAATLALGGGLVLGEGVVPVAVAHHRRSRERR